MRDDNKVFGQRICATAQSCMTMIRTAMRTFRIIYIDGLLRLLCANHPNTDKPKGEPMIPLVEWVGFT
jgi:hypothetical protein